MRLNNVTYLFLLANVFTFLNSCQKEEAPAQYHEPTKYEVISGDYKVYDTLGNFLYDMMLNFIDGPVVFGVKSDTIEFTNFDGEFNFKKHQGVNSSNPELYIQIAIVDTLIDINGKRWKLLPTPYYPEKNVFNNDTITMEFHKTNINYWLEDAVPFEECYCKQIAVKQH